jgi:hypothetical protein
VAKSIQIQFGRQQPFGDLKIEPRTRRVPLDVPCTYHKGARHTLRGCRLQKKIDQECDASHAARTPTSPDISQFQKAQIRISSNDQRSTQRHVLVVSANDPPRVGAMNSEEARGSKPTRTAPKGTMCPRPTSRVRGSRATDIQQPSGKPGCGVGTSPASQPFARGQRSHGLRLGLHSSGGGKERGVQVGGIYVHTRAVDPIVLHIESSPPSRKRSTNLRRTPC